ncbi:hypothetical protein HUT16_29860 [Kitasatospora sp. NA04385]|nr:hypothetical protein [Kitasatospora sp. NA04385]QKW22737.1 hypothetical protein HUT16_29860 [Kitasatospora sp. NA04385]
MERLCESAGGGELVLLTAVKEPERSHAEVLLEVVRERLGGEMMIMTAC